MKTAQGLKSEDADLEKFCDELTEWIRVRAPTSVSENDLIGALIGMAVGRAVTHGTSLRHVVDACKKLCRDAKAWRGVPS